jgi:ribosomal protein L20
MGALSSTKNNISTATTTTPVGGGGIKLDRKILAELAANEPFTFRSIVQVVEHITAKK